MNVGLCPQPEALRQYAEGSLPEPDAESVAGHLSDCAECDNAMRRIENEEIQLVSGLRSAAGKDPFAKEPDLRAALKVLAQLRLNPPGPDADSAVLANLSRRAGELPDRGQDRRRRHGPGLQGACISNLIRRLPSRCLPPRPHARRIGRRPLPPRDQGRRQAGSPEHRQRPPTPARSTARHFLVMEYVDGVDLSNLVRQRGPLPMADACELIRQAAVGLRARSSSTAWSTATSSRRT